MWYVNTQYMLVYLSGKWYLKDFDESTAEVFIDEDTPVMLITDIDAIPADIVYISAF